MNYDNSRETTVLHQQHFWRNYMTEIDKTIVEETNHALNKEENRERISVK